MTRAATMMLGGSGIVLVALIVLELRDAGLSTTNQSAEAVAFHPNVVMNGSSVNSTAASVALVLARPVFSPTRTAPARVAPAGSGPAALPRLSGIMISSFERIAVFTPSDGPPIIAREGTRIDAFTVQSIQPNSVIVSGPHGAAVLQTSFASVTAQAAAAPPATPFGAFGLSGATGSQWLDSGKVDLPNPATWSGPPMVTRLPVSHAPPASSPLLSSSGPQG